MTFRLGLAKDYDCNVIIGLVEEAAAWLRNKDTDQWSKPWPSRAARDARILADIRAGRTWIVRDGDSPAATITSKEAADQALAGAWVGDEPAAYVRRLVVARPYGGCGLGSGLLNWAGQYAARGYGARWIRIDVWKTNKALHKYYADQGFEFVSYCRDPEYPSGALFQKATSQILAARSVLGDKSASVCSAITGSSKLTGVGLLTDYRASSPGGCVEWSPPGAAGAGHLDAPALVRWVAEPVCQAGLELGEAVQAF